MAPSAKHRELEWWSPFIQQLHGRILNQEVGDLGIVRSSNKFKPISLTFQKSVLTIRLVCINQSCSC